ncbi:MAG: DUF433 domain-containing protein [Rubrivivax sp.]|jgi:uncharacterized protein (DUF433 family)|nr:DUF433 domain-containing protein [Betaproteobacteria bacterium]MBK7275929.1 DUF433 domain-containing protein [Betaproteobacteria bacterium]MBK7516725.1 DUF433 domain-containing protein [Betaproteobacteria bacterium]MBP6466061.1 DUF433 domain-containing protein [Rubrivivax sp.]MBP9911413.1 DUF433 domain-containing protein [Rubrivivax sp.]
MTQPSRITIDPAVCHGKPCVRGLRYPVENVLQWLASGMSIEEILGDYADLERDDILAVLDFAARLTHTKRIDLLAV